MFGISFSEFFIVIILFLAITNPKDIPAIARNLTKFFFKAKNIINNIKDDFNRTTIDLGLDKVKEEILSEVAQENKDSKKTTIIDLYGNEHEVHDIEKIRGDLSKAQITAEINKHNSLNQK